MTGTAPSTAAEGPAERPRTGMRSCEQKARAASSHLRRHRHVAQAPALGPTQRRLLCSPLPRSGARKRGRPLSGRPGHAICPWFAEGNWGEQYAHEWPRGGLLHSDCGRVGMVAVLRPAGTVHQVHRREASLWIVRVVPQVRGNRTAGASRGGGLARARLGDRPSRTAATARCAWGQEGAGPRRRSWAR